MEEYVQTAITRGLTKIIFLEHMEEGIDSEYKTWLSDGDFDHYFTEGRRLQECYRDRITIGLGVECGYNPEYGERLLSRLLERKWDQVGISCHFLRLETTNSHLNMFTRRKEYIELAKREGVEKLLDRYFAALTEGVRYLPGTMLCHLDGALRHVLGLRLTENHYHQIDHLLQAAKEKDMAIELNSSGLDIRGEQFPNQRILTMARAYNLPFVCGSDAHKPDQVGRHFPTLASLLPVNPR